MNDTVKWARPKKVRHWLYNADVIDGDRLAHALRDSFPRLIAVDGKPSEEFRPIEVFLPVRSNRFVSHFPSRRAT